MTSAETSLRLDKWLWAARFFKTRSLSAAAIENGKILLNTQRVKPAKEVRRGDMLDISSGDQHFVVVVAGVNDQRRPAIEARLLYEETQESLAKRQRALEMRKLAPVPGADLRGRPTKKAGRQIRRMVSVSRYQVRLRRNWARILRAKRQQGIDLTVETGRQFLQGVA